MPAGGGTKVTESFELEPTFPMRLYWALLGWVCGPRMCKDMLRTLHTMREIVQQQPASGDG